MLRLRQILRATMCEKLSDFSYPHSYSCPPLRLGKRLYVAAVLALLGAFFWLAVNPERVIDVGEKASVLSQKKVFTA